MSRITITVDGKAHDIPDGAVPQLQLACDRTNAAQKTALPLGDWLALHLQEIAIANELAAAVGQLRQQQEDGANAALEAAVKTTHDQLLAALTTATAKPA